MAKIREKKYSWEYYPDTYVLSRPSESQKNIIRDAEDGPLAKFWDYNAGENYFTFNTKDFEAHKEDIIGWLKRHPEFNVEKGTFKALYGEGDYDDDVIKYPNDKYIYLLTDYNPFENLQTKPYTYEPKDDEVIVVDMNLDENNIKEAWRVKSPLDYIEDKLQDANIDYTIEQAWGDEPYDTWITINDGQDSLADEIICSVVGYAYEWVRDKYGNRKYCKVVTDEDTINELNESLKGNHSFKGLTKKVVEAKETCSQDYLRYKKQLQKAKSIDELRKVWQTIKKDLDDDMTPEEDKHLAYLFLDRKKELKESLQEANGKKYFYELTDAEKKEVLGVLTSISEFVKGDKEISTYLYKYNYQSGSTETTPISIWNESGEVSIMLDPEINSATARKIINKIKKQFDTKGLWVYYDKSDGSLPPEIVIKYLNDGKNESLKEATGKIQKVVIRKQGNTKDRYKVLVNATNGKKSEEYLSDGDIKPFVNGLKKRYGDFEIEDPSNTLEDNTDLFKETFNDLVEETKRLMQEEDYNIHDAIYEAVSGLFLDKQIKAIKDYYRSLGNKYIEEGDEWYDCLADDIINDIKYGEGLGENLKESWIQFTFEDGSNPYVAKTKAEQDRMFKKYKGRVEQVGDITYLVKSKKKKVNEADDRYFSSKPSNDIKIKKFVREYADEIKDDIDNDTYDEYGMWSKYLDMFIMDFPKNKLTTSEFAIKFFDEINKKFGSNFHYGYTKEGLDEDENNEFKWAMDEIKYARSIYDLYKLDDTISNYSNDLTSEEISKLRHEISCRKSEMWSNQGRGR